MKGIGKKKMLFWTTFFRRSAGAFAFILSRHSIVTKADSRCRRTHVYLVDRFALEHYFVGSLFERYIGKEASKGILGTLLAKSIFFEHFCGERQT